MSPRGSGSSSTPLPWAAALLLALGVERALALPEICIQCPGSVRNLSEVAQYCKQTPELMLQARCCLDKKGTILGLDLQNCSLNDLGPNFPQAHTAVIINLQANPLKDDLANAFHGFIQLQTLLPVLCSGYYHKMSAVLVVLMPGILSPFIQTSTSAKGKGTFAIALGMQKCVLRMDLVYLMVQVFRSVFVLMASMATSVCAKARSHCLCSLGFWDPPHYPSPSCFGGLNDEKPRLHEPHRSSY
uniref:All-trans retinoic acid induced differentiation factor n=1 Tax=Molossus molossus TaxID=27622 RepID=A0A7J8E0L4_MOLMO|nr:all-trans retinoic acid induced differentiation factor [Molossus molossus]